MANFTRLLTGYYAEVERWTTRDNYAFGVGNTTTAWPDEGNPPVPAANTATQDEVEYYVGVTSVRLVVASSVNDADVQVGSGADIEYFKYTTFADLTSPSVLTTDVGVLLKSSITHSDLLGVGVYRSVGIYSDVVTTPIWLQTQTYAASDVISAKLQALEYFRPITVTGGTIDTFGYVLRYGL